MVKDGEDKHGLQMTNVKKFRVNFAPCANPEASPLPNDAKHFKNFIRFGAATWLKLRRLRSFCELFITCGLHKKVFRF